MARVRTELLSISYREFGEPKAPAVLVLHGWPDAASSWYPLAEGVASAGYRVIVPELRGHGQTLFLDDDTPRVAHAVALVHDALDLLSTLKIQEADVVGHDWGARAGYQMAALYPERTRTLTALSLPFQPGSTIPMPTELGQAKNFWYQWLMLFDRGVGTIAADPVRFAREQWDTWSPPGWFTEAEFEATARAFDNPDWLGVTLNSYRSRYLDDVAHDERYDADRARLDEATTISTPTLLIHGEADSCVAAHTSEGKDDLFTGPYRRELIHNTGHFPHREATDVVKSLIVDHLAQGTPRA